jgi:hypothetical protein
MSIIVVRFKQNWNMSIHAGKIPICPDFVEIAEAILEFTGDEHDMKEQIGVLLQLLIANEVRN